MLIAIHRGTNRVNNLPVIRQGKSEVPDCRHSYLPSSSSEQLMGHVNCDPEFLHTFAWFGSFVWISSLGYSTGHTRSIVWLVKRI